MKKRKNTQSNGFKYFKGYVKTQYAIHIFNIWIIKHANNERVDFLLLLFFYGFDVCLYDTDGIDIRIKFDGFSR